jgi:Flp pilus assembly pilin Flp
MKSAVKKMNKKGQGMTEYIIIVALVAIAAIAVIGLFGKDIKQSFQRSGDGLSGKETKAAALTYHTDAKDFSDFTNEVKHD